MQAILVKQIKKNHTLIIYSSYFQANQYICEKRKCMKRVRGRALSDENNNS